MGGLFMRRKAAKVEPFLREIPHRELPHHLPDSPCPCTITDTVKKPAPPIDGDAEYRLF